MQEEINFDHLYFGLRAEAVDENKKRNFSDLIWDFDFLMAVRNEEGKGVLQLLAEERDMKTLAYYFQNYVERWYVQNEMFDGDNNIPINDRLHQCFQQIGAALKPHNVLSFLFEFISLAVPYSASPKKWISLFITYGLNDQKDLFLKDIPYLFASLPLEVPMDFVEKIYSKLSELYPDEMQSFESTDLKFLPERNSMVEFFDFRAPEISRVMRIVEYFPKNIKITGTDEANMWCMSELRSCLTLINQINLPYEVLFKIALFLVSENITDNQKSQIIIEMTNDYAQFVLLDLKSCLIAELKEYCEYPFWGKKPLCYEEAQALILKCDKTPISFPEEFLDLLGSSLNSLAENRSLADNKKFSAIIEQFIRQITLEFNLDSGVNPGGDLAVLKK